ncbi:DUF5117 domain-containing protein, partial [Pseudoxanthomonas sp. SGD-10]
MIKKTLAYSLILLGVLSFNSCKSKKKAAAKNASATITIPPPAPKSGSIKKFSEIITSKAKTDTGLFNVHSLNDRYFYEIPDSLLGREMLAVTRYVKTPTREGTYGGEEVNSQVWRWERSGDKILIKVPSYVNVAAQDSEMYESVNNSNLAPILASFDIKAYSKDSTGFVIDITDLFSKDVQAIGLQQEERTSFRVQRLDESRSYIDTIKSFPLNIEARTAKTYIASAAPGDKTLGSVTIEFNTS